MTPKEENVRMLNSGGKILVLNHRGLKNKGFYKGFLAEDFCENKGFEP